MSVKVWIGVTVSLLVGLIWVAGQDLVDPFQIQAIENRNNLLINEQQRRIAGWRQYYINRLPYEFLIPIYVLALLVLRRPTTTTTTTETCPSLPTADSLGVFCCGNFLTSATCQASPQNAQCTWDSGSCLYECQAAAFNTQALCEGVGCSWTSLFGNVGVCAQ
ncbi:uncharacterized protein LOC132556200 [Ylistrum balloti]|uniref:uncharacterized protein LOC132556200 n=1 Tax=Ylistrum balloti TaxID=509963 RepID=UPI0029059E35|nr:uncharacterized protein LOC132556200 [Ylistrum balloti]